MKLNEDLVVGHLRDRRFSVQLRALQAPFQPSAVQDLAVWGIDLVMT
jgi:hypothetical protein